MTYQLFSRPISFRVRSLVFGLAYGVFALSLFSSSQADASSVVTCYKNKRSSQTCLVMPIASASRGQWFQMRSDKGRVLGYGKYTSRKGGLMQVQMRAKDRVKVMAGAQAVPVRSKKANRSKNLGVIFTD